MSLIAKLVLRLAIAAIASTLTALLQTGQMINVGQMVAFFIATATTALIVGSRTAPVTSGAEKILRKSPAETAARERGTVKWFNISKGFGFIVKDDGEEIFVHFRSIRGEGRRGLRDGQKVSFVVAQSDKGPQAEDVVGED